MSNYYLLVDDIIQSPYSGIVFEGKRSSVHFLLGHFQGFEYKSVFHINQNKFLNKDKIKFVLEPVHMPNSVEINLSQNAINLINTDPNVYLCLLSFQECHTTPVELRQELEKHKINTNKVIVLCSDLDVHKKTIHGVKYICVNFWESISRHQHQVLPDTATTHVDELKIDKANKKFLCLNRNIKPHRIWLMYSMIKSNVLDQGHISYVLPDVNKTWHNECAVSNHTLKRIPADLHKDYKMTLLQQMYSRRLDELNTQYVINYSNSIKRYYNDSLLSVVTESDSYKNFITEKTYKAIMNLHPFFIVGNPSQHSLLRARGYETFEDLFGVNSVMDFTQAQQLWKNINAMDIEVLKQNIKNKYLDKLLHNQQLFLSREVSWNKIIDNLIGLVN